MLCAVCLEVLCGSDYKSGALAAGQFPRRKKAARSVALDKPPCVKPLQGGARPAGGIAAVPEGKAASCNLDSAGFIARL